MKIKQIHYEVSDRLFFYMLQCGIPYSENSEELGTYWMDEFTFDRRSQLNTLGGIPEADSQTEFDHLCADVNWHGNHKYSVHFIGSICIDPEHPKYDWAEVTVREMLFEEFLEFNNANPA